MLHIGHTNVHEMGQTLYVDLITPNSIQDAKDDDDQKRRSTDDSYAFTE